MVRARVVPGERDNAVFSNWGSLGEGWKTFRMFKCKIRDRGGTVAKVLCYKSEGRWFEFRWCHWNFLLT